MATAEFSPELVDTEAIKRDPAALLQEDWRTKEIFDDTFSPEITGDEMTVAWVRETIFTDDHGNERIRRTGIFREIINEKERLHLIRMSFANRRGVALSQPTPVQVIIPGWTEMIDAKGSTSQELHDETARQNPESHILSIATPGVSRHGPDISLQEAFHSSGLIDHAVSVRRIIAHLAEEQAAITLIPVSMGDVIAYYAAAQNRETEKDHLKIDAIIPVVPCLVASEVPENEKFREDSDKVHSLKTAGNFFFRFPLSVGVEITKHPVSAVQKAAGALMIAEAVVKNPRKGLAIVGNFLNLLSGVPWEVIKLVEDTYNVIPVVALMDPMLQPKQLEKLSESRPERKSVEQKGRGHALPMDTKRTVELITRARLLAHAA